MQSWKLQKQSWKPAVSLPVADRGFRYGMSVFETIAVVGGRPLFLEAHFDRLRRAAGSCGGELPEFPEFEYARLWSGMLRFFYTAGPGMPWDAFAGDVYAFFELSEVGWNLPALRVISCAAPYLPRPGGWKTGNYWQNIDAMNQSLRANCDEALVFNPSGMLAGAAMGNVFLLIDGRWLTPALETGARDGVVREWVSSVLGASEAVLEPVDVRRCEAAFVTNSRIGIRSVRELDGRPLPDVVGEIQQKYFDDIFAA